jgi:hypothetical protein
MITSKKVKDEHTKVTSDDRARKMIGDTDPSLAATVADF